MAQRIRFARSRDGTALGWASCGEGPPMVKTANCPTHLEMDPQSPVWSHWLRFFGDHFHFVRYDERGCGLSDREVDDLSFDRWVEDLEAVIDAAGIDGPMTLLGVSKGAATAIAFANKYPERVSRIIIYAGDAQGWAARGDLRGAQLYQSISDLVALGWGLENPVFRELITKRYIPNGNEEQIGWYNDLCLRTMSAAMVARLLKAREDVDVRALLGCVAVPALVMHSNMDEVIPFEEGRLLASGLPDAEFVELQSRNHIILQQEPAWIRFKEAVLDFMDRTPAAGGSETALARLSRREREVVGLIGEAKSNPEIASELGLSERTVRNHASNLFRKLGVKSRAEAILHLHGAVRR
ncbi:alpha/beta fold hydrolase [Pelagibius litoralis]|uniref:Alpha/beta fold hydrolase n=1 Tax=Pelagibius litoralis TaxID=374515 RepID=A0A967C590_9PROT|nr:alpha/beta fold hydrolase [Pelagibius litoralis]NIA69145.1 alpha/beta fold hydrolase [Pelagibius litoralis]